MSKPQRVAVVGAGVIGVSTAVNIQSLCPDVDVSLIAENFTPDNTSDVAAGFLQTYLTQNTSPADVKRWFLSTWNHVTQLISSPDAGIAGVHYTSGYNILPYTVPDPDWKDVVFNFRHISEAEMKKLFPPEFKYGWFFTSVICECLRYIPYLLENFQKKGGRVIKRKIASFAELSGEYDVIVNCTGMGARFLANDDSVVPVRGQVMKVHAPWFKGHCRYKGDADGSRKFHVYPGQGDVIVGGTTQEGRWDREPDPKDAEEIWERACAIYPSLKNAKIKGHLVGLRPLRKKGIRVEAETMMFGTERVKVVHNYGHGGCGITLHWGCAEDAAQLVKKELARIPQARL